VKDRTQLLHPILNRWVMLDTRTGRVLKTKRSPGPYVNVERRPPYPHTKNPAEAGSPLSGE
jgi:hypothetical protein